jgi:hypothetical protein
MDESTRRELEKDYETLKKMVEEKKDKIVNVDIQCAKYTARGEEEQTPVIIAEFTLALDNEEGREFIKKFFENFMEELSEYREKEKKVISMLVNV